MWSLPNISSMNATKVANQAGFKKQLNLGTSKKHTCENCNKPSTWHYPYYDIFSDDISGVTHLCNDCEERGLGDEGFFTCAHCERRMIENITWERYCVEVDGELQCLACAAKNYFADADNLIDPAKVTAVIQDPKGQVELFNSKTGVVNICRVQHVLAVKQPVPAGIVFVDNFENCNDAGRFDGQAILETIKGQKQPVFLVLDAAYQFSISVGIYAKA